MSIGNTSSIKPLKIQCVSKRKRLPSDESLQLCDGEHSVILVYPFDGYQDVIGVDFFIDGPSGIGCGEIADGSITVSSTIGGSRCSRVPPNRGVHHLTFTVKDAARLEEGRYFNDTLIDFYMKWYVIYALYIMFVFMLFIMITSILISPLFYLLGL